MNHLTFGFLARLVLLAVLMPALPACQTVRQFELQATRLVFSPQQEAELGRAFAEEIEEDLTLVDDPVVQAWIEEVGQELVRYSPPSPQQFTFQVVNSEQINAFAIPGGFCYVNSGLILFAENEAEVVAVIGHEINHVTTRHGMRSLQRALGLELMAQAVGGDAGTRQAVEIVQAAGGMLAMRSFGREDEREADRLGVEAMYRAGWDPRAAVTFFEKLHAGEQAAGAGNNPFTQILSTHPTTTERIRNIREQVAGYDLSMPLRLNSERFEEVQRRLAELAPPSEEAEKAMEEATTTD